MTEAHPCLLSVGNTVSRYRHFPFLQDVVKIGRAADATYTILSTTISRCHAIIEKQGDGAWTIIDNKSLNGIAVNNIKLQPLEPRTLQDGDIVQLGVPASPEIPAEFVYRFFSSLKVRKKASTGKKRPCSGDDSHAKRHKELESTVESRTDTDAVVRSEQKEPDKQKALFEEQLQALAQQLKEKEEEKQAIAQQLQEEREQRQEIEEKQKQQEEKVSELDAKQKQLAEEKAAVEKEMRQRLEEGLREREELLQSQMREQLERLAEDKQQVEERLQQEMEKAVQEKDRELQDRLEGEKDRLQKIIENKELEQKALESQLAESRVENEKARADTLTAREAVLSKFAETMETELQCAICNELFVKATSLNCSHAFCSLCIRQWLVVKKECPNCRTAVTSQMRSIVLDNYIDRMVEQLSADMKESRVKLVAERKEAEQKLDEAENKAKAGPSGATARGRGQQRGRSRASGRGRGGRAAVTTTATRRATSTAAARATVAGTTAARATVAGTTAAAATVAGTAAAAATTAGATGVPGGDSVDGATNESTPEPIVVSDAGSEVITDSDLDFSDEIERFYDARNDSYGEDFDSDLEMNSDDDEDHEDYVRGTGAYYGGYGRCFKCGARGHWANGCPYG